MSIMVNICLVLHPLNTIKDVIEHTGLVRNIYAEHGKQTYYIIPVHLEPLLKKHLNDLTDMHFEIVPELSKNALLRLLMGKYKNVKKRMFYGEYDNLRLDNYKNIFKTKYNSIDYNPYTMYDYDESIRFTSFKTNCYENHDKHMINLIKSVANMDYRIFSNGDMIPLQYKKNSTIAIHINKMFNITNFFDCIILIEKTKHLHLTDTDEFSVFIYTLWKSGNYEYLFNKKHVFLFYKGESPIFTDLPASWKLIKNITE
jgi:hypothetical protein